MIELTDVGLMKKIIPALKSATVKGQSNDGTWCIVYYNAYKLEKSDRQIAEAEAARKQNLDLHVYAGPLESINASTKKDGSFVFTILSVTRVKDDEFKYRSFNIDKGEIVKFIAFPDFPLAMKVHTIQAVEIPGSWIRRLLNKIKDLI